MSLDFPTFMVKILYDNDVPAKQMPLVLRVRRKMDRRGGGVATQRPAKPSTPVRFRSAPPA